MEIPKIDLYTTCTLVEESTVQLDRAQQRTKFDK